MEYVLAALAGWVGAGWPISASRIGGGSAGTPNPEDPDPPLCWVCNLVIGAVAAVIIWAAVGRQIVGDSGLGATILFNAVAGSFGASLVRGGLALVGRR